MAVSGPAMRSQTPRRPGCVAWCGAILAATMALCCVGGIGGAGAEWLLSRPDDPVLPDSPTGFPVAAYLPEASVDNVTTALTDQGYECDPDSDAVGPDPSARVTDAGYRLQCSAPEVPGLRNGGVVAEHDQDAGFRLVTVVCAHVEADPTSCRDLFTQVAGAVLVDHAGEARDSARSWIEANLGADATTTEPGVELTIRLFENQDHAELRIGAA